MRWQRAVIARKASCLKFVANGQNQTRTGIASGG